jgi:cellulose biosynthesis protein BcsQ
VDGLAALQEDIAGKQAGYNTELRLLGAIITMFQANPDQRTYCQAFRKNFQGYIFEAIIPNNQATGTAASFSKPAVIYDKEGRGAAGYRRAYKELLTILKKEFNHGA